MQVIYIDCSRGVSGSALLGALVELGAKPESLVERIKKTVTVHFQLDFIKRIINGAAATAPVIEIEAGYETVLVADVINSSGAFEGDELGEKLKSLFDKIIQAQARVSGLPVTEIAMPEEEIIKMLIIAAGFFTALDQLQIKKIIASPLPVSLHSAALDSTQLLLELARGTAVKQYEIPEGMSATPLGVALLTCVVDEYGQMPAIQLFKTGYGFLLDEKTPDNTIVRILYGKELNEEVNYENQFGKPEIITVLETAIDDMNPEFFPFLVERLLSEGALDAFLTPIYMKKGRPAHLLTVLCRRASLESILYIIFQETTTLGVRIREERRRILPRFSFKVNTPYGEVSIKAGSFIEGGSPLHYAPEFEDCKVLALRLGVPVKEIYEAAQRAAYDYISKLYKKTD